jgi:hypothetical protein
MSITTVILKLQHEYKTQGGFALNTQNIAANTPSFDLRESNLQPKYLMPTKLDDLHATYFHVRMLLGVVVDPKTNWLLARVRDRREWGRSEGRERVRANDGPDGMLWGSK